MTSSQLSAEEKPRGCKILKIAIVGDSQTGKTALFSRFCKGKLFDPAVDATEPTSFVNIAFRDLEIEGKNIRVNVWDTAGLEFNRAIVSSYYKDAAGVLLVYDVTNRETFFHLKSKWLAEFRVHSPPNAIGMLIGNKCDLSPSERKVGLDEGFSMAANEGMAAFAETSATYSTNVDDAFVKLITEILDSTSDDPPFINSVSFY